jgi:hypothetical protein
VSQSVPSGSAQPEPAEGAEAEPTADVDADADAAPLNRAARRAKAAKATPSHVGPRGDLDRQSRGARPHTKRQRG